MAITTFTGASGGAWNASGNWSNGVPQAGDTAIISRDWTSGTPFINVNQNIGGIAQLDIGDISSPLIRFYLAGSAYTTEGTAWTVPNVTVNLYGSINDFRIAVNGTGTMNVQLGSGVSASTLFFDPVTNANGWSGRLNIPASVRLITGSANRLGTADVHLAGGSSYSAGAANHALSSKLYIDGNVEMNNFSGDSFIANWTAGTELLVGGNRTVTIGQAQITWSGQVTGSGLIKAGASTLALSANNTGWAGPVQVTAGTLSLTGVNALASAIVDWGVAGQTGSLTWTTSGTNIGGLNTSSGTANALNLGTVAVNVGTANTTETFAGALSNSASLTKVGTGKWTLTSNSTTRTGATTVTGGELELTASNAIGNTTASTVNVGSLGTLTLNGTGISVPAKATTLSGVLQNKTGSNIWAGTISTVASETTAEIRNATAGTTLTNNATFGFASGSTLTISGDGDISKSVFQSLSNVGTLVKNGNGTFSLTTFNVYGSTVQLNAGTISITSLNASGAAFQVNGGSFITTASNLGFDGSLSGTGGNIACASATARTITVNTGTTNTWSGYFGSAVTNGNNFALTLSTTGTQLILRNTTSSSTHTGTTTVGAGLTLDGSHTFSSSTVSAGTGAIIGAGGWNGTNGGLGDFTVPTLSFSGATTGTIRSSKKDAVTAASRVVVTGALTKPSTTLTIIGAGTGWSAGTAYEVASYGSVSGAGALAVGSWSDSVNPRIGNGTASVVGNSIYLTPAATNQTTTWAGGGAGGAWFNEQPTGWSQTGPAFLNGDTVVFDASNTTAAELTSNVSVASLTMQGSASQTINGVGFSITNAGSLNISSGVKTINVAMNTAQNIVVGAAGTFVAGHVNTLGGTAGAYLQMSADQAAFTANTDITTSRILQLNIASGYTSTITKNGGSTLSFTNTVAGSTVSGVRPSFFIKGHGVLEFTSSSTTHYNIYEVDDSTTTPGQNVYRTVNNINSQNTGLKLGSGGIYENATSGTMLFTRFYGSGANQFQVVSGGGFSRYTTGTMAVNVAITYGTSAATQWVGTAYFGTAFGTQQGTIDFSGAQNINGQTQTFHVFNGATTSGSSASISGKISGSGTIIKAGPGRLTLNNGNNDFTASVSVTQGRLTVTGSNNLNSQAVTLLAGAQLQTKDTSGVALSLASLTAGAGSRIIIGGA